MGNLSSRKGIYVIPKWCEKLMQFYVAFAIIKWYQNITKITNILKTAQRNRFQNMVHVLHCGA